MKAPSANLLVEYGARNGHAVFDDNDPTLTNRFIEDAPFSKFYLEVDKDSPGRIGAWFGWQIVNAYMRNNDMELQEMILLDNEELFKKSKFKPRKK